MTIGKIVSSQSQYAYLCQVWGPGEVDDTPIPADYALGQFVDIAGPGEQRLVGVIGDTRLLNPAFGSLGPRLSPEEELRIFTPDYLAERVTVVDILAVGAWRADGTPIQGIPRCVAQADAIVSRMDQDEIRRFHQDSQGALVISYLPTLMGLSPSPIMGLHLAREVLATLGRLYPDEAERLAVLAEHMAWNSQIEAMR